MLDEDAATQVLAGMKGGSTPSNKAKSDLGLLLLYFVAMILHLLCSRVDVQISNIASQNNRDDISFDDVQSVVHKWRGFSVPRSILCIAGWLISCYQFVANNNIPSPANRTDRELVANQK